MTAVAARRPLRFALLALAAAVLALVTAACEGTRLPVERSWQLVLPPSEPADALPVTVVDETGVVKLAEPPGGRLPPMDGPGGASFVDGDRTRLLVGWVGGACDRSSEVRFSRAEGGWRAAVTTEVAPGGCDAVGIGRAVVLDLADGASVDPAAVQVTIAG